MDWISVNDSLPPAKLRVIIAAEGKLTGGDFVERGWVDGFWHNRWYMINGTSFLPIESGSIRVTHWAKVNLPPRPEGE